MTSGPALVQTHQLTKTFGETTVVNAMSLAVHAGTIHALLGENGAGKSTFISMLAGALPPTSGTIEVAGKPVAFANVRASQQAGIVALPQERTLVPTLGAAENIYLGVPQPHARGLFRRRALYRQAKEALAQLGQQMPLHVPVQELSAVQQTMIAICRALVRNAKLLILDEPTAALTDTETTQLFSVLRTLRDEGTAIIYVSHRLDEVLHLADIATVMRNGHHVWTKPVRELDTTTIITGMLGEDKATVEGERLVGDDPSTVRSVLSIHQLNAPNVHDITLEAHSHHVLGIAGLAGAGRSELLHCLAGATRVKSGTIRLNDVDITRMSIAQTMAAGVALVPEERRTQGLLTSESVQTNVLLANMESASRWGMMRFGKAKAMAQAQIEALRIKVRSAAQPVNQLSGGNQQKVVLAKMLQRNPKVLLLDEPTRGIDIGTKTEIYQLIRQLARQGVIVIVVSSEIPELLAVADSIAVLHEGSLVGIVPVDEATESTILHMSYKKVA